MKTIFKVFALEEQTLTREVWLSNNGVEVDEEMITYRLHQADLDTELEAKNYIKNKTSLYPEHGFEIVKVFIKQR